MKSSSTLHGVIDRLFEHSFIFNINQILLDGGKHRPIRQFLADVPYASVIDLGCGPGNWVELARGDYLGLDTSPSFIETCREKYRDHPDKQFLQADVTDFDINESYDLGMLISVLHHLSDEQALHALRRTAAHARFLFILDLYPIDENPVSKWLYGMDRGDYIRAPAAQKELVAQAGTHRLLKEDAFYSWNRLYRHTIFLYESTS